MSLVDFRSSVPGYILSITIALDLECLSGAEAGQSRDDALLGPSCSHHGAWRLQITVTPHLRNSWLDQLAVAELGGTSLTRLAERQVETDCRFRLCGLGVTSLCIPKQTSTTS